MLEGIAICIALGWLGWVDRLELAGMGLDGLKKAGFEWAWVG